MRVSSVSADGLKRASAEIMLLSDPFVHGAPLNGGLAALTESYLLIQDASMRVDRMAMVAQGSAIYWDSSLPARFGLVPRDGRGPTRWCEAGQPGYFVHVSNSWEEREEWQEHPTVLMHGCWQDQAHLAAASMRCSMTTVRLDVAKETALIEPHSWDRPHGSPTINSRLVGSRGNRFVYFAAATSAQVAASALELPKFGQLVKYDLHSRTPVAWVEFGEETFGDGSAFVPRTDDVARQLEEARR